MHSLSLKASLVSGARRGLRAAAACFALLWLLLCAALPAFAGTTENTEAERTVRVGFFPFEGYYEVNADGVRSGYGYELLQHMAMHANFRYEYVDDVATWGEMEQMLASGELDMLTCVQKTAADESRFSFSATAISSSYTMLTVRSGDTALTAGDYSTYEGIRVGVIRDNAHAQKFAAFAAEKGFTYTEVPYDSLENLEAALQAGKEIDACVTSSLRPLHNEWILEQFDPSPYYMMMRRDDTELRSAVDSALHQMDLSDPDWRTELYNQYYAPDNGNNLQLSAAEREYIDAQTDTVFRVAVNPDNKPYSYFENGEAKGILPEIFAEIAKRAGIRYTVIETADYTAYDALLRSGEIDLVMDSGWDHSSAENLGYKLTDSYLNISVAQLTKASSSRLTEHASVPAGPIQEQISRSGLFSSFMMMSADSVRGAVNAVANGSCDAAFLYSGTAQSVLRDNVRGGFRMSLLPSVRVDMSVAVRDSVDFRMLSVLSKSANSVRENFAQQVVLRDSTGPDARLSLLDYLYLNPGWAVALAGVLAAVVGLVAVAIAQRVYVARQHRLTERMEAAKREADSANEAKSTFLSGMSHDLRTPLNGIVGFTDLALREQDPAKKQEYLGRIKASGDLLADLVDDTLELSRIESGKMTLELENVSGEKLGRAVLAAVRPAAELKGVHLEADETFFPNDIVSVDRIKLQKVVLNLLSNAVKYTPPGGTVRFSVSELAPEQNHGMTRRIVVADTGIGMSADFLSRLYEPFAQEHRPEARGVTGTGLGLTIVKRIVDLMGGTIAVESAVGRGTSFTVELPIQPASADGADTAVREPDTAALAGRHVLLCEDNPLNTEIATLLLREHGMEVTCAADGAEGLRLFEASSEGCFDAVLMDIRMPDMGGCEAAQAIRALPRRDAKTVPIVAMSADAFEEDMRRAMKAGMNSYITKPVDPAKLLRTLGELIV